MGISFRKSALFSMPTALLVIGGAFAEDARVLPEGRSRLSYSRAETGGINQTFDRYGNAVSLTAQYNFKLDAKTLSIFSPDFNSAISTLNATGLHYDAAQASTPNHGVTTDPTKPLLGDAIYKGFLGVDAEAKRTQSTIQYQYGVTDRLSVGFGVPIIATKVRVNYGIDEAKKSVQDVSAAVAGYANTAQLSALADGLDYLNKVGTEDLQNILTSRGYARFQDYDGTGIGDVVIGGRYNYLKTRGDEWINSVQLSFTAPTGSTRPPADLTQVDNGQGCWDAGVAHITNWTPPKFLAGNLLLSSGQHFTHRLPGQRLMRVRNSPSDAIPDASTEETLRMKLGDKFWTNLGAKYYFSKTVNVESSYEWYWKSPDHYQGKRNKDYGYLTDDTALYLETWNLSLNISTINAFLEKRFLLPLDLSFSYFIPVKGVNAVIAPYGMVELAMYF